ncbi:MAG TPA: hypothetical protein PK093_10000 [Phycisphaerae bacterium]|nr:hypothetical protein [Phycisphaerae bacterium]
MNVIPTLDHGLQEQRRLLNIRIQMVQIRDPRDPWLGDVGERPNAVFIFAYARQRYHAEAAGSWVGQLYFTEGKGKQAKEPEINISEERLAIMFEPDEDRFGLTEEQRKKVFYRLVEAEDRAMDRAGANAADVSKYDGEMALRLEEKYIKRICKKYKITREQAKQIAMEGAQKGWPMPPSE